MMFDRSIVGHESPDRPRRPGPEPVRQGSVKTLPARSGGFLRQGTGNRERGTGLRATVVPSIPVPRSLPSQPPVVAARTAPTSLPARTPRRRDLLSSRLRPPSGGVCCRSCGRRVHFRDRIGCNFCRQVCCLACIHQHGCNCVYCMRHVGRDALYRCKRCGIKVCCDCYRDHLCITEEDSLRKPVLSIPVPCSLPVVSP